MRWRTFVIATGLVWSNAFSALAQTEAHSPETLSDSFLSPQPPPVIEQFQFIGLRRIRPPAIAALLSLHSGDPLDETKLRNDVQTLGRLGWFDSIRVEKISRIELDSRFSSPQEWLTLVFHCEERPILAQVEYSGSRLLSSKQIEKLLEEKKLAPGLGRPADPVVLQRIAFAIRSALNELGHPEASVKLRRHTENNGAATVRFEIDDGPHLPVRSVQFTGHPLLSGNLLRGQMHSIAPWSPLAELRGKNAYTREVFEQDRQRILTYYQDHGYPEARVANAQVSKTTDRSWKRFLFPHRSSQPGLALSIPVEAGPFYRLDSIDTSSALEHAVEPQHGKPLLLPTAAQGSPFSQQAVDKLRRFYSVRLYANSPKSGSVPLQSVVANPAFDADSHSAHLKLALSDSPPYLVHRLEFQGLHKFSDRYVRHRIPLREGRPVDDRALEAGLNKLARTGYFKPIRKENIHIQLDESRRTADIRIQLEEIGRQRTTFSGGHAQFGSSLGLAYTVFDLFSREELLSAKLDAGPESLQIALGIAKEGIFGTRGSLAFSVFNNVLRPRLTKGVQGPFFNSYSEGVSIPYTYALTNTDSLGVNYNLSRTATDMPLGTPPGLTDIPPIDIRTKMFSSSLGTAWAHDSGNERTRFSDSVSGGALGGNENMLRASGEAARIFRDPLFPSSNAWAFRTTFNAAGSYRGDMPLYARFLSGDEFVRGLSDGELGPYAMSERTLPSGVTMPSPSPTGANLITAANAEYRIPLHNGAEAVAFFDLGSGWLLPNWLGPTKPTLLSATNGVLHGSTGIEFCWTIPGIQVPLHTYYALNLLRLDRRFSLTDKSFFFVRNRLSAFGWGLGSLF
ncbi:MAG TPA: POTRA domain-containing protein [Candidatus Acidoferrum sp.]|nr:POTRA domain-containing protein [Candidatus Acidoferrum sp.]